MVLKIVVDFDSVFCTTDKIDLKFISRERNILSEKWFIFMSINRVSETLLDNLFLILYTVFENHRKSLIQHCERQRATFTFWVDKSKLKMAKMVNFGEVLKTWSLWSNSVTRQVSFNRTKIGENAKMSKIQMRHFE